jgi:hypothetical protein
LAKSDSFLTTPSFSITNFALSISCCILFGVKILLYLEKAVCIYSQ